MTFHPLHTDIPKPRRFTFPFCYEPHPLCLLAARDVQEHIESRQLCGRGNTEGKMFGVLIVEDKEGRIGFLAAYSGLLQTADNDDFFVPPVFDAQHPDGYFKRHEREITALNREIDAAEKDRRYTDALKKIEVLRTERDKAISCHKAEMLRSKAERDAKRRNGDCITSEEEQTMIRESQFMKAELRRIKKFHDERIAKVEHVADVIRSSTNAMKKHRRKMSDALQEWLFRQYVLLNAQGEARDIVEIFMEQTGQMPPAGTGDCCAPKLLQYAFAHSMLPVCMAEFWWGTPPKSELRRHGNFYPSCSGKCKPLLSHMLKGIDVDDDPMERLRNIIPVTVYEDDQIIVVDKPTGCLSVPGRSERPSVLSFVKEHCPDASGPMIVHRLDMATSGLLVVTKNAAAHKFLQEQFRQHKVTKRYSAVLDGEWNGERHGTISIPLSPDILDRPRQKADYENGREAITEYIIKGVSGKKTYIQLFPHTGRTHQLRVHCAHKDGLGLPIVGDELYGKKNSRLHLHAERLEFIHPKTLKRVVFESLMKWDIEN